MSKSKKKIDYYALTDAQKRVEIARDVLARLKAQKIRPQRGTYFELGESENDEEGSKPLPAGDLREALAGREGSTPPCEVCALGALFYGQVMLGNGVTLLNERFGFMDEEIKLKLKQVFSQEQMREIETAFEGNYYEDFGGSPAALEFYRRYERENARGCLRAICENIVENNGTFKP